MNPKAKQPTLAELSKMAPSDTPDVRASSGTVYRTEDSLRFPVLLQVEE